MPKAAILTLGCKANQFESAAIRAQLESLGFEVGSLDSACSLVVVNTCTVTGATDTQSRKLVRRAQRISPQARIFVTGCAAQVEPTMFSEMPGVERIFGNMEKQDIGTLLRLDGERVQVGDIAEAKTCPDLKISRFPGHSRAFVQIQSGCNNFCSYCIIPYARGRSRSVPSSAVIKQVQTLADAGFAEIVLTGIHIGQYGKDLSEGLDLAALVKNILELTSIGRIRLGSIEPQELTPSLLALIVEHSRVCSHLHIPLQSGSDPVLQRMQRTYSSSYFSEKVTAIKETLPGVSLGFDVITGFPGESDAEFDQTRDLLERLPFNYLHVFPYSLREGTAAAQMPDQVPVETRRARAALLRELAHPRAHWYAQHFIGKYVEVVFRTDAESANDSASVWKGLSGEYLEAECEHQTCLGGGMHQVLVKGVERGCLICDYSARD
jgi:threonylcarbamoyladenosine tRNA methylthiotransferase MtaB